MSMPLYEGGITLSHGNSDRNQQVFLAAEAIWGIESDKLPAAKFNELMDVMVNHREEEYGPCRVKGFGDVLVIQMDPIVLNSSYKKKPCSLDTCMVTDAAKKCSKCMARYCSREHQLADWQRHKLECISHI